MPSSRPTLEPRQLTTAMLLAKVCGAWRQQVERTLRRVKLHVGQDYALLHLWEQGPQSQTELIENLGCKPATITRMLQRMERDQLIHRERDKEDARVTQVSLTGRGHQLEEPVRGLWLEIDKQLLKGLNSEERATFRQLLMRVLSNVR